MDLMKMKKDGEVGQISTFTDFIFNIVFVIITLICILPLLFVIIISFTNEKELLMSGYTFFPKEISFKAYSYIVAAGDVIWRAYGVSIFVTVAGTLLSLLVICMYAYPLSRNNFRHKSQFTFLAYFTMIFGGGLVPWYIVYTNLIPIRHTIWILIVPYLRDLRHFGICEVTRSKLFEV
jgi:putative aldouronate transport system permease protein